MKNFTGFTLIETMIAVTILTLAVSGPLFTASRAIVAVEISQYQLTASYLAQEGIEYVRAMRDDAYLNAYRAGGTTVSSVAWTDFLSGSSPWSITKCRTVTSPTVTCTIDPNAASMSNALTVCTGVACDTPLSITNGTYTYQAGGQQTPFSRTIQIIDTAANGNEERVISTVKWSFHNIPYSTTIIDHLTSWQ